MIRRDLVPLLLRAARQAPSVTLTGPRQSGKTTLCRALFPRHPYVSLESPDVRAFAIEDPRAFLAQYRNGAVLDEIQRAPEILSYLQAEIDEDPAHGRWILSGSQNLALLQSVSQTLAGRTAVHHLLPLTRDETTRFDAYPTSLEGALLTGGYPRILDRRLEPSDWLGSYVATYLERDVRTITNVGDLASFQRFVQLCAGRTGQLLNYSSLAKDCGVSQPTAKAWMGILEASFIVFRLPPYHGSLRKRLVKMPKLYFHDSGLACWLLGIRNRNHLLAHPLRGAIFETWAVGEVIKHRANSGLSQGVSFYRDRGGAEVDLVIEGPDRLTLVEAKSSVTPSASLFRGTERVRRHFDRLAQPCEVAVAYGGEQAQERSSGQLLPWRMMRGPSLPPDQHVVTVTANGRPVAGAEVSATVPDGTTKATVTDRNGEARLGLDQLYRPLEVVVRAAGCVTCCEPRWVPAERPLHIDLREESLPHAQILPRIES